jgi:protein-disulfide isomerase
MRKAPAVILLSVLATAACSRAKSDVSVPPAARTGGADEVVAEVDGKRITRAELDAKAAEALATLRQQEYETLRRTLDQMIVDRLVEKEARARNLTREALVKEEIEARVPSADPSALDSLYEQHKDRFRGQTREQAIPQIQRALRDQGLSMRRQAWSDELRSRATVKVTLEPPRAHVAIPAGTPVLGPDNAPVTMVEFSDYQCPYCRRAQGTVEELVARYKDKLRLVHRDFPLDGHPGAVPAARAARCAGEQGKFWEYHRALLTAPGDFSDKDFKGRAEALGLERARFDTCLASDRHDAAIKASVEDGARIGVTGTPAFFINGRMIFGARRVEDFAEIIEAELRGSQRGG